MNYVPSFFPFFEIYYVVFVFFVETETDCQTDRQTDRQIDGKRYTIIAYNLLCHKTEDTMMNSFLC